MRSYIRHPSDIPIEFHQGSVAVAATQTLVDVSCGDLSFAAQAPIPTDSVITVRISYVEPVFEAPCRVTWCRRAQNEFLIGVEFLHAEDEYRARMVEQVCHIEHYKKEVFEQEGRVLTGEQAAREWIRKFAKDFPALSHTAVSHR